MFLNKKERAIAKHNKIMKEYHRLIKASGHCCTCKYSKRTDGYYHYCYNCKLYYEFPREEEKCEHHVYKKKYLKILNYVK